MTLARHAKTTLAFGLALQVAIAAQTATTAQAQMISTDSAIARTAAEADRASLMEELKRQEVRDEIVRLGVSPDEAEARLAALSDAEVKAMLGKVDDGVAGADIVGTLATIFLILLVTDLLCLTRLFNFTRCVR